MRKLIFGLLLLAISQSILSQSIQDHVERSKAENRFKENKNLKTSKIFRDDRLLNFVYDSTTNELFKVIEANISNADKENEYQFHSEQLYYSKTDRGINYFFNRDYYFDNFSRNKSDEELYNYREKIITMAYRCVLVFRNFIANKSKT